MILISSADYSRIVLLFLRPTSRISQSSRQRGDGEAVNLCCYLTCVVLHMYQYYAGIIEGLVMSLVMIEK